MNYVYELLYSYKVELEILFFHKKMVSPQEFRLNFIRLPKIQFKSIDLGVRRIKLPVNMTSLRKINSQKK